MAGGLEYGLIGEKLGHSFSPAIHHRLADYDYRLVELKPEELGPFLEQRAFSGLNVTIPYKKAVIPYCQELTPQAGRIGSVNTIVRREDGTLLGHNTDYDGFAWLLRSAGARVTGKKALILGTGGVSLTVKTVLEDLGAGEIVFISRSGPNNYENLDRHADAQILVNATPVGMYPNTDTSPVDLSRFPRLEGAFDLIYNPARTRFLLQAEARGLCRANGLGMLVAQAKAAAELFLGIQLPDGTVETITRALEGEKRNLLLIGMPGCGKSTVGRALAARLGRPLVDLDAVIERETGRSIPDIFAREGEAHFRHLEHDALSRTARESGQVIAAGGGIVTQPDNLAPMRQNSAVIFLHRELDQLPVEGRPISQSNDLGELYRRRLPLYEAACDLQVENRRVEDTVEEIIRRLGL